MTTACQGDILIGIEVLTELEADAKPAGFGRSAPNMHPELPPPTGRIKLVRAVVVLSVAPCRRVDSVLVVGVGGRPCAVLCSLGRC